MKTTRTDCLLPPNCCSAPLMAAVLALSFALGGCVSSEGLSTQGKMTTLDQLATDKSLGATVQQAPGKFARTWPAADWWHSLGDSQLDALVDEAVQGSPDIALADARLRKASAAVLGADAGRKPTLSASAGVQAIHLPSEVLPGSKGEEDFTPRIVGLSGSYSGSLLGMRHATWEAALGREHALEVDNRAARLALSAEVVRAYARLAHAWQSHDLATQDIERSQHLLALTQQRVKAGIDSIAQQRQAESSSASARKRMEQALHAIDRQRIMLAVLVGKGPDRANDIDRPAPLKPLLLQVPDNLPADLLGRRPDIVAARWRVQAASKDIEASEAAFYPSFNLNAALGFVSFPSDELLSLRSRYYSIAPALTLPIFDAGRVRAGLAGSNAGFDIAVAEYNKTLASALSDVVLQIRSARSLDQQSAEQRQALLAATDGWQMSLQRYKSGIASQVETLTLQQSVLAAEAAMADVAAEQIEAAIRLVQALGGGYSPSSTDTAAGAASKNQTGGTPS